MTPTGRAAWFLASCGCAVMAGCAGDAAHESTVPEGDGPGEPAQAATLPWQPATPAYCEEEPTPEQSPFQLDPEAGAGDRWLSVTANLFCVPEGHTKTTGVQPVPHRIGECRNWPDFFDYVLVELRSRNDGDPPALPCGPCGFRLCKRATLEARTRRSDACCYVASSPGPP